ALALALALAGACAEKLPEAHVMPLVNAERTFGLQVAELGVAEGFAQVLAPDAVLLGPAPIPAATAFAKAPSYALSWEPTYAEVSASGDLGYTTGPYHSRHNDPVAVRHGHYVSVWRKDGETWRLVVDGGSPHPPPLDLPDRFTYAPRRVAPASADRDAELRSLRAAEDALVTAVAAEGPHAVLAVAAPDLRYHPPGSFPVSGRDAVQTALLARADALTYVPRGAGVSAAGDLGYVWGEATRKVRPTAPPEQGGYLRIWRRGEDGRWQLALDLTVTTPPAAAPEPAPEAASEHASEDRS
ncbi:MAG TPA: nuclear transport factor 2 family protein, partial [Nannocystis sp.]